MKKNGERKQVLFGSEWTQPEPSSGNIQHSGLSLYRGKPRPIRFMKRWQPHGPVRVIRAAQDAGEAKGDT